MGEKKEKIEVSVVGSLHWLTADSSNCEFVCLPHGFGCLGSLFLFFQNMGGGGKLVAVVGALFCSVLK